MDILEELTGIFKEVMENDDLVVTRETTAADVEEWDSISHIMLITSIEKHFKLKFSSQEILKWENVGQMVDAIQAKKG